MELLPFLFVLVLLPAVPILVAPRHWARAAAGWILLGIGLILIDIKSSTPSPFDDDGMGFDFTGVVVFWWTLTVVPALLIRWRALIDGPPDADRSVAMRWLRDWAVPLGFLIAAGFLHWLANRIAGASPAWLVHILLLAAAGGAAAAILWRRNWRFAELGPGARFAFALPVALALLVLWAAAQGFGMWSRAQHFAGNTPWCAMSYGGFQHERLARSGWDLSPLVNRRYGNWAVAKARFLTVGTGPEAASYRWFVGSFRNQGQGGGECQPTGGRA